MAACEVLLRAEALDRDELVAERRGEVKEAKRRFARARRLAPDEFPEGVALSSAAFDARRSG